MSVAPNHHPPAAAADPAEPGTLRLSGRWTLRFANEIGEALRASPDGIVRVDARAVERIDTLGVLQLLRHADRRKLDFDHFEFRDDQKSLIAAIEDVHDERPKPERDTGFKAALGRLGHAVVDNGREVAALVAFLGELLVKLLRLFKEPSRFRLTSTVHHMEQVGLDSAPLVALLSFMVGAVIAFLGAMVLRDFGATIFVVELGGHLHAYGTTAQRLEGAVEAVAKRLGLECEPWVNPTGMILAFSDPARPAGESDTTRVIRLGLGDTDLYKLCEADRIAEDVMAGRTQIADGRQALRALSRGTGWRGRGMQLLGFALASAAVAGLLRLPWLDIATAGVIGLLIGLVDIAAQQRPRLQEAADAISGLVAGTVAILVSNLVAPLNLNTVIIASLIVLLPGMSLTNAVNELTSRHLVSGTARFAGALTTILKLTIGTAIALTVANLAGLQPEVRALRPQPDVVMWAALLVGAYAFAVLIALIGCLEGLQVAGTAQSLGERTTSSVVQSISMVIVIDALAALWFMEMDY